MNTIAQSLMHEARVQRDDLPRQWHDALRQCLRKSSRTAISNWRVMPLDVQDRTPVARYRTVRNPFIDNPTLASRLH